VLSKADEQYKMQVMAPGKGGMGTAHHLCEHSQAAVRRGAHRLHFVGALTGCSLWVLSQAAVCGGSHRLQFVGHSQAAGWVAVYVGVDLRVVQPVSGCLSMGVTHIHWQPTWKVQSSLNLVLWSIF
jgi:hypothetical protein